MISVIIPVYNGEDCIEKCVNSLLTQTYKNFEIIIVNDGSTDTTRKICESISSNYCNIKLFNKKRGGSASARNEGLKYVKGEYIVFVDADDLVHKCYLEFLYRGIVKYDCDIAQIKIKFISEKNVKNLNLDFEETMGSVCIYNKEEAMQRYFDHRSNVETVLLFNKIYKKFIFENVKFIEGKATDDQYVVFPILNQVKRVAIIDNFLYYYVQSPNSQMRSPVTVKKILDVIDNVEFVHNYLNKLGNKSLYEKYLVEYCGTIKGQIYYFKSHRCDEGDEIIKKYSPQIKPLCRYALKSKYVGRRSKLLLFMKIYLTPFYYFLRDSKRKIESGKM